MHISISTEVGLFIIHVATLGMFGFYLTLTSFLWLIAENLGIGLGLPSGASPGFLLKEEGTYCSKFGHRKVSIFKVTNIPVLMK